MVRLFLLLRRGNQVLFINWYRVNKRFGPRKRVFHESPGRIYTGLTCSIPIKRISQKVVCFGCLLKHFEASLTNSVDPDQIALKGAV